MQTLILSCNTGAGHNSCAQAVQEAYHSRGEICNITDSLQFISEKASTFISNWHTRIYRHAPRLFDAGYQRAESHEDIFCEGTPIYKLLSSGAERMYQYIRSAGYDNIICTHVFPALALTEMRRQHPCLQLVTSHISTDYELTGKSAVLGRLNFLHGVPELFTISPFLWGIFRQKHLLPDKPLFSCVVMLNPVVIVIQTGTAQISGSSHGGASCASADHLRFQMINRHILFTSFFLFLLLFRKRENGRAGRPSISAAKLPVAGLRRQGASCFQNGNN